jgi:predicted ATPase
VRVLATSREPLRTEGEHVHRLSPLESLPQRGSFPLPRLSTSPPIVRGTRGGDMNEFELTDADAAIVAEICENWTEFAIEFAAAREPVAEHNDMVKAIPPDRTVPMPGKMARSATRPPFGLPEGR